MTDAKEEAAFWAELAQNPDDTAKLALADWYAEHGDPVMEHGLRWCVARGHWPRVTPVRGYASWGRRPMAARYKTVPHELPPPLTDGSRVSFGVEGQHRTLRMAVHRLAFALDQLLILCGLPKGGAS